MCKLTTKFINNTGNKSLANPFANLRTDLPFHDYLKELAESLLHYHPAIKQNLNITIDGDDASIIVTFS